MMAIKLIPLVAIAILVIAVLSASKVSSVVNIFGETDKGNLDPNRWTGETNLTTASEEYCQHTWSHTIAYKCKKYGNLIRGTVTCIGVDKVAILSCNCLTYDPQDCITIGKCPYTCGLTNSISQTGVYKPTFQSFHYLIMYLKSTLQCVVDLTGLVGCAVNVWKVTALWSTLMI